MTMQHSVTRFFESQNPKGDLDQIKEIFFLTSVRKDFTSPEQREVFFDDWTEPYFQRWSKHFLLIREKPGSEAIMGYLSGCMDSESELPFFDRRSPIYRLFSDCFHKYPAHLHINCHPRFQGQGLGTQLLEVFIADCQSAGLPGLHIITSPSARNVSFYLRNGFDQQLDRQLGERAVRWMGRRLIP